MIWAPLLIKGLVAVKFWKKRSRSVDMTGKELSVTKEFYDKDEAKVKVPRAGGILVWATTIAFALFFWFVMKIETNPTTQFLNIIDRRQTFIPLGTLFFAAIAGFIDDALATMDGGGNYFAGGLKLSHRFGFVTILGVFIGIWFYFRLLLTSFSFYVPNINFLNFDSDYALWPIIITKIDLNSLDIVTNIGLSPQLGWLIIPVVIVVLLSLWGSSMIDGFDGLATGVFIPLYLCFAGLSFSRGFYEIAALLMVMVGAMAAYLWYNIPPAKFYMGDTGTMSILLTLGVVALLIDALYVLPIAGFLLLVTEGSVVLQTLSKKFFKKKVFLAAPIHHHFEAAGWLRHQVTMRYWLVSIMTSVLGLAVGLLVG
jgi:phospho-N-acetylmuramoyl-pentapeptide-transferase